MVARRSAAVALVMALGLSFGALAGAGTRATNGLLAYTSFEQAQQLFSMDGAGGDVRRASTSQAAELHGVLSPDRTRIAFVSHRDGNPEIYVMNADGTGARRLTSHPAWDGDPDWSPDSQRIVFESERDDPDGDIFVVGADGSGLAKIAATASEDLNPAWSPTGALIAFESDRDGDSEIFVTAPDGTRVTQLTRTGGGDYDRLPEWSPDGSRIVFTSDRGTQADDEIWVMNADGTSAKQLTSNRVDDWQPDWSPDGTTIAFTSDRDSRESSSNLEIYVMDFGGATQTNVSRALGDDFGAAWGTDDRLLFASDRHANVEIALAAADGSGIRVAASNPAGDYLPAWSPDGKRIAFTSQRDGDEEVYLTSATGGRVTYLTRNGVSDYAPTWSRTGRRLAFIRAPDDEHDELWVASADGTSERRILRTDGDDIADPEWSPDGRWIALSLDDKIAVVPSGGGHPRLIAWSGENSDPTWSPDGAEVAFVSERGDDDDLEIYIAPLRGGRTRQVTRNELDEWWLDWSPDGRWIAFSRGYLSDLSSSIFVIRPDGSGERRIPLPTPAAEPAWQALP